MVQFSATLDGQPVATDAVRWTIDDTALAQISTDGTASVTACWRGGRTAVRGRLLRDTTVAATTDLTVLVPAIGFVLVQSIKDAVTGQDVDLHHVHDSVDVTFGVAKFGECPLYVSYQLRVTSASKDTVIAVVPLTPPTRDITGGVFRWNTTARVNGAPVFPNGEYRVTVQLLEEGSYPIDSNSIPLEVDNP